MKIYQISLKDVSKLILDLKSYCIIQIESVQIEDPSSTKSMIPTTLIILFLHITEFFLKIKLLHHNFVLLDKDRERKAEGTFILET